MTFRVLIVRIITNTYFLRVYGVKKLFVIAVGGENLLEKVDHEIDLEYNFQGQYFLLHHKVSENPWIVNDSFYWKRLFEISLILTLIVFIMLR